MRRDPAGYEREFFMLNWTRNDIHTEPRDRIRAVAGPEPLALSAI